MHAHCYMHAKRINKYHMCQACPHTIARVYHSAREQAERAGRDAGAGSVRACGPRGRSGRAPMTRVAISYSQADEHRLNHLIQHIGLQ
jgi:hypothetical protein